MALAGDTFDVNLRVTEGGASVTELVCTGQHVDLTGIQLPGAGNKKYALRAVVKAPGVEGGPYRVEVIFEEGG